MGIATHDPKGKSGDHAKESIDKAKEAGAQGVEKAKEAVACVGEVAGQAACAVGKKADDLVANAGSDIKKWGNAVSEKSPHEGLMGHASHAVAGTLKDSGQYLEEAKLSGMAHDVSKMIHRNPVPAVVIGLGLGFVLGRALRS